MSSQPHPGAGRIRLRHDLRQLLRPLGISLIIHALIFWQAPGLLLSPESPAARHGNLRASLQQPPAAAPVVAPRTEPTPPRPSEPAETAPARQPEERSYAPTPPAPAPPSAPASEPAAPDSQPATPVEPLRTGIDVAGLRQYHLALGQKAKQFRRYPAAAREAGWQGRVAMRLAISESGAPIGITLLGSSNFPVLDQAALEMMFLAAGHTEVPESLRGRAFTIDLAVDFKPDDAP
ncbi:MAG TPA: energy transducer TonB [Azonexus sp.]|nr:energy transducer TonB [Azonexus sp.]